MVSPLSLLDEHLEKIVLPRQIWFGDMPSQRKFNPVVGQATKVAKPVGGIWTADYDPEYGSTWKKFLDQNREEGLTTAAQNRRAVLWDAKPKENAKVLNIETNKQLDGLPLLDKIDPEDMDIVDYQAIREAGYHGMRLNPNKLDHLNHENLGMRTLISAWEVPSTVWFGNNGFPFEKVSVLNPRQSRSAFRDQMTRTPSQPVPVGYGGYDSGDRYAIW